MARKQEDWRTNILRDGERRYVREVIRPTLADLKAARARVKAKMPKGKNADQAMVNLYQAELERIDAFEARVKQHAEEVHSRFGARTSKQQSAQ